MDDAACFNFFSQPTHTYHRQYEALRAVFVDGRSQKDVAQDFGFEYNSFRQLVGQFRRSVSTKASSDESPFFETSR
jgi:transposase